MAETLTVQCCNSKVADFEHVPIARMMPQWVCLDFLMAQANCCPMLEVTLSGQAAGLVEIRAARSLTYDKGLINRIPLAWELNREG